MNNVFATVIIDDKDASLAQDSLPGHFTVPYESEDSSIFRVDFGFWYDYELDLIANQNTWFRQIYFGDPAQVLSNLGLRIKSNAISN
jgi:hypothetical protein